MNKSLMYFAVFCGGLSINCTVFAADSTLKVMITPQLESVEVLDNGQPVVIRRNQNLQNRISGEMTLTSRECPPHCIQPIKIPGIETVGELEVLDYLKRIRSGDDSIMVVDTRAEKISTRSTIPGSINIFGDKLIEGRGANPITTEEIFTEYFGVTGQEGSWNFGKAKTLVLFCYGVWCGQGPRTIQSLIKLGYPKRKLKWYRGGMQTWESLGLTTKRTAD